MDESHVQYSVYNTRLTPYLKSVPGCNECSVDFPARDVKHFVGGFHSDVTEEDLRSHFSKFGEVADVKIMRDLSSGRSRGFGFITMADPSSKAIIGSETEHIIGGRRLSVRPYSEQNEPKEYFTEGQILKRKVFIGGINPALGQDTLESYFRKYGAVEDASIMRFPDGKSRGFGFVVFKSESTCQQVLQQRNHYVTQRDKVEVKPCLSKGKTKLSSSMRFANEPAHYGNPSVPAFSLRVPHHAYYSLPSVRYSTTQGENYSASGQYIPYENMYSSSSAGYPTPTQGSLSTYREAGDSNWSPFHLAYNGCYNKWCNGNGSCSPPEIQRPGCPPSSPPRSEGITNIESGYYEIPGNSGKLQNSANLSTGQSNIVRDGINTTLGIKCPALRGSVKPLGYRPMRKLISSSVTSSVGHGLLSHKTRQGPY